MNLKLKRKYFILLAILLITHVMATIAYLTYGLDEPGISLAWAFTTFVAAGVAARILNKREFSDDDQEEVKYLLRVIANNTDGGGRDSVRVLTKEEMRRRAGKKKTDGVREHYEGIPIKSPAEDYLFNNGVKSREEEYKAYKKFEKDWDSIRRRLERPEDKSK